MVTLSDARRVIAAAEATGARITNRVVAGTFRTPGVANVKSSVVLREVKYETALPVD